MKVHISYWPSEARKAAALYAAVSSFFRGTRIKRKTEPDGRQHIYFRSDP